MTHSNSPDILLTNSLGVVFGFLILLLLPFEAALSSFDFSDFYQDQLGDIIRNIVIIIYAIVLIRKFGYEQISSINSFSFRNIHLLVLPLYFVGIGIIYYSIFDFQLHRIESIDALILFFAMMSVGYSEELIFRGFVQSDLTHDFKGNQQALLKRVVIASALFGVLHLFNIFQADKSVLEVLAQVTYATMFGVCFGIILLRTGSIWGLGFLHGIINFTFEFEDLPGAQRPEFLDNYQLEEALISVLVVIPLFVICLNRMKKVNSASN